jgi:plastocyanin
MVEPLRRARTTWTGGLWLAGGCALFALAGGGAAAIAAPQTHVVTIEGMRFQPETLNVRRGDRVSWVNKDLVPHTVTHAAFDSRTLAPEASWTLVARKPGTYAYVCTLHPTMKATLVVQRE